LKKARRRGKRVSADTDEPRKGGGGVKGAKRILSRGYLSAQMGERGQRKRNMICKRKGGGGGGK